MPPDTTRTGEYPLPALGTQLVTATVRREARRLVHLSTEHEDFVTTPEHPFATPASGWIRAERLAPGEWVVSERFGAVRLWSVRSEAVARPVPVFNLSVASSHAYFVGTDRVLVHNTQCGSSNAESREQAIERLTRERDALTRDIAGLRKTRPMTPDLKARISDLTTRRNQLQAKLNTLARKPRDRKKSAQPLSSQHERSLQHFEAESETLRNALEESKNELAEGRQPPEATKESSERKAELERQIQSLTFNADRTNRIVTGLRELVQLEKRKPATDEERRARDERMSELSAQLKPERARARQAKRYRVADPKWREERKRYQRELWQSIHRSHPDPFDDHDPRVRLQEELAHQLREPLSESRHGRILHLKEQFDTRHKLTQLRKERRHARDKRYRARQRKRRGIAEGMDTSGLDKRIEEADRKLREVRVEILKLRLRERLLAHLDGTPWGHPPGSVDEAQLREFESQLARGLEDEELLSEIERALDEMGPTDADVQEALLDEAQDVEEVLNEREDLIQGSPSPERTAGLRSSYERLQQELREARAALEASLATLANEYAHTLTTQAASSSGPSWQERLSAIQREQQGLLAQWRTGLRARRDSAQRQLDSLRSVEPIRDEEAVAELTREITLLESELRSAGG